MAALAEPTARGTGGSGPHPLTPVLHRVVGRTVESSDVVTLALDPVDAGDTRPDASLGHGQFNMLTAFGVGEVALSVASEPGVVPLEHSIRDVGSVTHALSSTPIGGIVGVRGPFGTHWGIDNGAEHDVVVVAGGIGLAPLRGAVRSLVRRSVNGERRGGLYVLVGARSPGQLIFADDLRAWRRDGAHVALTVDVATSEWGGHVGVVTTLVDEAPFDASTALALVCGPEIMMRFAARALVDRGVDPGRIRVSIERNMQCGVALCGHCQLGPLLLCRDGPVVPYGGVAAQLLDERER